MADDKPLERREMQGDEIGYVSPTALARHWGVSPQTVYRDIRKHALAASRLPGGRFRIRRSDAMKYGRPIE